MVQSPVLPPSGVLVADFGRVLAAPYATMLLADLGADVVKIEQPGAGDETRAWGPPFADGQATYFLSVNRNKRSFAADLREEAEWLHQRDAAAGAAPSEDDAAPPPPSHR